MPDTTTPTRPAHTPGPWHARGADGYAHVGGGNPVFKIADVSCGRPERAEDRANASLIAAAPALLEALKEVTRCLAWHAEYHGTGMDGKAVAEARSVIAKATGSAS